MIARTLGLNFFSFFDWFDRISSLKTKKHFITSFSMRCYLKIDGGRIQEAKYEVLGCPGAISAAMALADLVKGKELNEALKVNDRDVCRALVEIPDQKQHCIRLAVKTMEKAIKEYQGGNAAPAKGEGEKTCPCSNSSACNAVK